MLEDRTKLANDATDKVKGFLYQFYMALNYCFELKPEEKLYIEKYGDITISDSKQIEVKNYSNPLTDTQDNLWKTLHNWIAQSFYPEQYKTLILLTTQEIGKESKFNDWNKKTLDEKHSVITSIANEYCEKHKEAKSTNITSKIEQMSEIISEKNQEKLKIILDKFVIIDSATAFGDVFDELKIKYARHIPEVNQKSYLNALFGFVINPETVENNNWEITEKSFSDEVKSLTSVYHSQTIIFPKIKRNFTQAEIDENMESRFVSKIDSIEYSEVKEQAIQDFLTTNNLLLNELAEYKMQPDIVENYENELLESFRNKRRRHCRKISQETDTKKVISESQELYDEVIDESAQAFMNYNDTPKSFRNGFYHILADEDDEKIVWLLKNME